MGKRVSLHYEEKVGLPTSCFGETRHYVTQVTAVEEIPLAPASSCRRRQRQPHRSDSSYLSSVEPSGGSPVTLPYGGPPNFFGSRATNCRLRASNEIDQ